VRQRRRAGLELIRKLAVSSSFRCSARKRRSTGRSSAIVRSSISAARIWGLIAIHRDRPSIAWPGHLARHRHSRVPTRAMDEAITWRTRSIRSKCCSSLCADGRSRASSRAGGLAGRLATGLCDRRRYRPRKAPRHCCAMPRAGSLRSIRRAISRILATDGAEQWPDVWLEATLACVAGCVTQAAASESGFAAAACARSASAASTAAPAFPSTMRSRRSIPA